ncbi:MAG: hypothetical protein KF901_20975 [Myxococcales bacterium]|nr:hypothetical protein [Myxococcales bacterium]
MNAWTTVATLLAVALAGCPRAYLPGELDDPDPPTEPTEPTTPVRPLIPGEEIVVSIGAEGGRVELGELTLEVPAGALGEPTEIRVGVLDVPTPTGFRGYSPIVRFEPAGLRFATPATISMPFAGDARVATVFWTNDAGGEYVALPTRVEGGLARSSVEHFSQAFVGSACQGGDCCRRATSQLDLLFVVDNSNSMAEEQAALAEQIPRVVRAFVTGDLNADGVQDVPAVASLQVAIVTTDMGTGGFVVPTCHDSNFGDDGLFQTTAPAADGCALTYDPIQTFEGGDDPEAFVDAVSCLARRGTNGCGFEQQLESPLKALTPSTSATRFHANTFGHGDGANAGFLRPDAVLAVVMLTDEDDCSVMDPNLFDTTGTVFPGDLNLRCFLHPEAVHPTERFVQGILDAKGDPARIVFAPIAGIPVDLEGESVATMLADPRLVERVSAEQPTRLEFSCDRPGHGGVRQAAFPPRRILEAAAGLQAAGAAAIPTSICQDDLTGTVGRVLERVAARVAGTCD